MRSIYLIFAIGFLLFYTTLQRDWQGYGNLSGSNLSAIWNYINSNIDSYVNQNRLDDFSTELSTNLNNLWNPAWNVITVQTVSWSDTILYGYAFRSHWMWYNNYQSGSKSLSFVIWKDYNCYNWKNVGSSYSKSTFQTNNFQVLSVPLKATFPDNTVITDIWRQTKSFIDSLVTKTGFSGLDKAFSIIASQDGTDTTFYGRVCLVQDNWIQNYIYSNSNQTTNGLFLLFQTRSVSANVNLLTSSQVNSYINAQLQKHNEYRAKHGCGALVINNTLTDAAQNYTEYLATQIHSLAHSSAAQLGTYGENLYWGWGSSSSYSYGSTAASIAWYSEISKYTYGAFPPASGTGHFTAMIWKSVTSVGFGFYKVQETGGYGIYVTANYYPTPNIYTKAYYDANVPAPLV